MSISENKNERHRFFLPIVLLTIVGIATSCNLPLSKTNDGNLQFRVEQNPSKENIFTILPPDTMDPASLTGLRNLTKEEHDKYASLSSFRRIANTRAIGNLPRRVNNAETPFFRPIFDQAGGSCGQATGVGYVFTYELDYARGVSASFEANQYPTHYTWNYLNDGNGAGSWYFDGWEIIKENGVPNIVTWGGMDGDDTRWMSGFDKYVAGMGNRVVSYEQISDINTPEGLLNLKQWLYDHGNGSMFGGVASFAAYIWNADFTTLPAGSPDGGKMILLRWGDDGYHAMTIVGYDDDIRVDLNGDGRFTNDIDINGDGTIDMKDWEIGALVFANSWGTGFGNNGFSYMSYSAVAVLDKRGDLPLTFDGVHIVKVQAVYKPTMVLKISMTHSSRNLLSISADIVQNGMKYTKTSPQFQNKGGSLPMQGAGNNDPIEFGLDVSDLFAKIDPLKSAAFNLNIVEQDESGTASGEVRSFSLVNYTGNTPVETTYQGSTVPISNNTITTLSISYGQSNQSSLRVQHSAGATNQYVNTISLDMRIYNDNASPVSLSDVSVKYWYTFEGSSQAETATVDWAGVSPSMESITPNVRSTIAIVNNGGQSRAYIVSFGQTAATIPAGGYVELHARINKSDWTNYDQFNDYSFSSIQGYHDVQMTGAYFRENLAWGTEP